MVLKQIRKLISLPPNIYQSVCPIIFVMAAMLLPLSVQADDTSKMAKLVGQSMLLDGASSEGLMSVVGERGHVLISSDGKSWQQIIVPTRTTLTGVYFRDKQNGWVVGLA